MKIQNQCTKSRQPFVKALLLAVALSILASCSSDDSVSTDRDATASASYRVTFTTGWTAASFPTSFPAGSEHFSGLIGGTHNDQIKFWEVGQLATDGIENMAETGEQGGLSAEVSAAKIDGKAEFILSGSGNSGAGSVTLEFDVNETYPLVTLVSMVAPSPDWFVGVRDLSLFDDGAGDWKQTVSVNLAVYDAGTDSGTVFKAGNADTLPPETISLLSDPINTDFTDGVGAGGRFIAAMTFERIK